jgi:hypothetical protein
VFSIVELKTATLDYGTPGISQMVLLLLFLLMIGVSMIPYLFLYVSLGEKKPAVKRESRFTEWLHAHRHPHLLHH